jgi:hypothetical protein
METIRALKNLTNESGRPMLNESQLATFRKKFEPFWKMYQENARFEDVFCYMAEREIIGFSYSNSLFNLYSRKVEGLTPVADVVTMPKGTEVSFVAFVDEVKKGVGRESKKSYIRFDLNEESGAIKAMISGDNRIDACAQFNGRLPISGDVVVCHGQKGEDAIVFVNSMVIQHSPIALKAKKVEVSS